MFEKTTSARAGPRVTVDRDTGRAKLQTSIGRRVALVVVTIGIAVCAGCGRSDDPADPRLALTLIDAGVEPRSPLLLGLVEGKRTYDVRQRGEHPDSWTEWRIETDIGPPVGTAERSISIRASETRHVPEPFSVFAEETARVQSVVLGRVDVHARLRVLETQTTGEPEDPATRRMLKSLGERLSKLATRVVYALPDRPVGIGARWIVQLTPLDERLPGKAEAELMLKSRDATGIGLNVVMRGQVGEHEQPLTHKRVLSTSLDGKGELRIPAGNLVAEGTLELTETAIEVEKGSATPETVARTGAIEVRRRE